MSNDDLAVLEKLNNELFERLRWLSNASFEELEKDESAAMASKNKG